MTATAPTAYSGGVDEEQSQSEPTDALWSRLRVIESQSLGARAAAYSALHEELTRRLDAAPRVSEPAGGE